MTLTALDNKFQKVNAAFCQMVGYTESELVGHTFLDITHPDDRAANQVGQELVVRGEKSSFRMEKRYLHKEGHVIWGDMNAASVQDAQGRPLYIVTHIQDITERKRAEKALWERERLLQAVIDGSMSPIFLKDCDGKFITINASLERMLGMSREEVRGKTDYDIAPKEVADCWRTHDTNVMATGKAIQIEEVADLQDGHHVFLANKFPLVDADGQVYGVGAISHDITERRRAEEAVQRSEALLRAVTNNTPDPIFLKDCDCRLLFANPATLRAIGKPAAEVIGKTDEEFYDEPEVGRAITANDRRIIESGRDEAVEEAIPGSDGTTRIFLSMKSPFRDAQGQIIGIAGVARDITERKRAEESLRKSEQEFRTLTEAMPQIVWATRPDGWNIYFNQQWVDYTGLTLDESYGHGWNIPFHPDDKQRAWDA